MTRAIVVKRAGAPVVLAAGSQLLTSMTAQAKRSRDDAQSAAAAVLAAAGVGEYADTAAGLAATTIGETFWVDQGDGRGRVYRHDSGPVATGLHYFLIDPAGAGAADIIGKAGGGSVQDFISAVGSAAGAEEIGTTEGPLSEVLSIFVLPIPTTMTVGPGGDQPTFMAACDRLESANLRDNVTVQLLVADEAVNFVPVTGRTLNNPMSRNIFIEGSAFGAGKAPATADDMTGVYADDLAFLKYQFPAWLKLNGPNDTTGTFGLATPFGIGGFKRLLLDMGNRYNLDAGFRGSHAGSTGNSGMIFTDVAAIGGTWGVIGPDSHFVSNGQNLFAHQISGGPFDLISGATLRVASGFLDLFAGPSGPLMPKTGINMDGNCNLIIDRTPTCGIRMKGPFVNGVKQLGGYSDARDIDFDGVIQPWTVEGGQANIGRPTISNANFADLDPAVQATQLGIVGNSGDGTLIHAGMGAVINHNGAVINGSECKRYVFGAGGRFVGYGEFTVTDSKAANAAFEFADSPSNSMRINVSTPRAGSQDLIVTDGHTSTVRLYDTPVGVSLYTRNGAGSLVSTTSDTFTKASMIAVVP